MAEAESLSLTGPGSHVLVRKPGVGNVIIGPGGGRDRPPDLVVDADDRINWSVFDSFTVPAGYPWPRGISYEGSDVGFFAWSESRPIETFSWTPTRGVDTDARAARIARLGVTLRDVPVRLVLPPASTGLVDLSMRGDLSQLTVDLAEPGDCPGVTFYPSTAPSRAAAPTRLPDFHALDGCPSVDVYVSPLRQPFDCASLTQFPAARQVSLSGAVANLDAMADLRNLEVVRLLYCPDLTALPPLATWPNLRCVIASNIEEQAGQRLRADIAALARAGRTWEMTGVSQLRRPDWFEREYGLPFSQWPRRPARTATTAFRAAATAIGAGTTRADVELAITQFVEVFNGMADIETTEREDVAEAIAQLAQLSPVDVSEELALTWFDAARDF